MTIELSEELALAVQEQAQLQGLSADEYVRELVKRSLPVVAQAESKKPLESGRGMWIKYGFELSAEDIDENRADMLKNFGESF